MAKGEGSVCGLAYQEAKGDASLGSKQMYSVPESRRFGCQRRGPRAIDRGVANYLADRCYDLEHVIHNLGLRTMVPTGRWLIVAYCGGRRAVVAMDDPSSAPQAKALLSNA
jgi:hypothetical protein